MQTFRKQLGTLARQKEQRGLVNQEYWDKRNLTGLSPRKKALYKAQKGICPHCKGKFTLKGNEVLETHHLIPIGRGGKDKNSNVGLFHAPCQKQIQRLETERQKQNLITTGLLNNQQEANMNRKPYLLKLMETIAVMGQFT